MQSKNVTRNRSIFLMTKHYVEILEHLTREDAEGGTVPKALLLSQVERKTQLRGSPKVGIIVESKSRDRRIPLS